MDFNIDISLFRSSMLFNTLSDDEIVLALKVFKAQIKKYEKSRTIFFSGQKIAVIGVVLSGVLHIEQTDWWGNLNILHEIKAGEIFGIAFAAVGNIPLANDVVAATNADVLFIDAQWVVHFDTEFSKNIPLTSTDFLKIKLIQNLYQISCARNRFLTKKLQYLSCRSTRDKLLAYLSDQAHIQKSDSFNIPFDRQQLADYLSIERSAMSAELSKMQREGLLTFKKNHFMLQRKSR